MKRCRFNKLISLYLDREISPEELHELNQELERSEANRKRFRSAIIFNKALREKERLAEEITSPAAIALRSYTKWGAVGLAASIMLSVAVLQVFQTEGRNAPVLAEKAQKQTPVFLETKAPLRKAQKWPVFQASFKPMSFRELKSDIPFDSSETLLMRKNENSFPTHEAFGGVKFTQVTLPVNKGN